MSGITRRRQINAVLGNALMLDGPDRERLLDRECRDDRGLREAVESLLDADRRAGAFMARPLGRVSTAHHRRASTVGRPGERIGAYRLIRQLGTGGMATVHLARRHGRHHGRPEALKLSHVRSRDETPRNGLDAERRVLGRLDHPSIVRLRDAGTARDDRPFLVMEWIDGLTIDVHCRQHRLSPRQRLRLILRVCAAVEAAHERGVVHCDLKPANILVRDAGIPVLIDFGIATVLDPQGARIDAPRPRDDYRVLTPGYASPEQRLGGPITVATDIYLLGLLLLGLLARPAGRVAPQPYPRARSWSRLPRPLGVIVRKALEPDPHDRHRSVAHLSAALSGVAAWELSYNLGHEHHHPPGTIERPGGDSRHP